MAWMRRNWRGICGKMARRSAVSAVLKIMVERQAGLRKRTRGAHRSLPTTIYGSLRNPREERTYVSLTPLLLASHECADPRVNTMQVETKFLRLRTPVTLGSRFGGWWVTWLGGWSKYRLFYLVMVVKIQALRAHPPRVET